MVRRGDTSNEGNGGPEARPAWDPYLTRHDPAPDASVDPTPSLTIEPFTGYRLWRLVTGTRAGSRPEHPVLLSATRDVIWKSATYRAVCRTRRPNRAMRSHPGEPVPALGCMCGVYAMKEPMTPPRPWMWAHGRIELTGRVLEGTKGYRAERGRIVGPLQLWLGAGPNPTCLKPRCGRPATWVRRGPTLYLPRCEDHLEPPGDLENLPLAEFRRFAAESFTERYQVAIEE